MKISLLLAALWLLSPAMPVSAQLFSSRAKREAARQARLTPYEKFLSGKPFDSARGEFLSLHTAEGKLYIEFPVRHFGRRILIGSSVGSTSDARVLPNGYLLNDPLHVSFCLSDSAVVMKKLQSSFSFDPQENSEAIREQHFTDPAPLRFPVLLYIPRIPPPCSSRLRNSFWPTGSLHYLLFHRLRPTVPGSFRPRWTVS
ncbi:MAG: DUF5118 domain-containing protein [Rikenellaceae bacterium]|nr:DUF5118 domain-containing protein [Rikenellaceae bacterium]